MSGWSRPVVAGVIAGLMAVSPIACASGDSSQLAAALSDEQFWALSTDMSGREGEFRHSDNLVSNEALYPHTVRMLRPQGGVYIGVGPEQNFSYIARIRPDLAFIVDIRDDNRSLHLFYKALFEVAADRAEFVARLFSRERPPGLDASSTVDELFAAVGRLSPSSARRDETARAVRERLTVDRRLPLSTDQWQSIERIISAFYTDGPAIHYGRSLPETAAGPSYVTLMTAADMWGRRRSFLASEDAFALVKDLHLRNVIVPVVGDFGSVDTLRRVTDYIRRQGATVSAFYASNVEVYLSKQQMAVFCGHLAGLPATARTWFIGSKGPRPLDVKLRSCVARS